MLRKSRSANELTSIATQSIPLSYVEMMRTLVIKGNKFPDDIPKDHAIVDAIAIIEHEAAANLKNRFAESQTTMGKMAQTLNDATHNITTLKNVGNDATKLNQEQLDLFKELQQREQERSAINHEIAELTAQKASKNVVIQLRKIFGTVARAFAEQRSAAHIEGLLKPLNKPMSDLDERLTKLQTNETSLKNRIEQLYQTTVSRIDVLISSGQVSAEQIRLVSPAQQGPR